MAHYHHYRDHHHQYLSASAPTVSHAHPISSYIRSSSRSSAPILSHVHPTSSYPRSSSRYTKPSSSSRVVYSQAAAPPPPPPPPVTSVDPFLACNPRAAHASIEYDLTLPPSHILISHGPARSSYAGLSSHDLARPATSPPQSHLHIRCGDLPWTIDIYPASGSSVVSVGDVLHGVYRALRRRVTAAEWNASSAGMQQRVRDAWLRRCKRQQSHKERTYESNNGLRRIDWLTKRTVFQGLTAGRTRDQWVMHVGQGEKSVKFWAGS